MKQKREMTAQVVFIFFSTYSSGLNITEEKGSISVLQIPKIHFWALSTTYYSVKISFKC